MEAVSLTEAIVGALNYSCERDDVKTLRTMLRQLFGKSLQDLVMRSSDSDGYVVESPELKEALSKTLAATCAASGSIECLKLLLQKMPDVVTANSCNNRGVPCLQLATVGNHVKMAEFLIGEGADIDGRDPSMRNALHCAIAGQQPDVLSLLLANRASMTAQDAAGATPLHYAVQVCCNAELDEDAAGEAMEILRSVLPRAISELNKQDARGRTPLHYAAAAGKADVCRLLVRRGAAADISDGGGNTALHAAARGGFVDLTTILIKEGRTNVNAVNSSGQSSLLLAAEGNHVECVKCLLDSGAKDIADGGGKSAVHVAATVGSVEMVTLMHKAGHNLWRRAKRGELPMHFAVIAKHNGVVRYLFQNTKSCNLCGPSMKSSLHMAASTGNVDLMSDLIQMGVHINAAIKCEGVYLTALDVAERRSQEAVIEFITKHGGSRGAALSDRSARVIQRTVRRAARTKAWQRAAKRKLEMVGKANSAKSGDEVRKDGTCEATALAEVAGDHPRPLSTARSKPQALADGDRPETGARTREMPPQSADPLEIVGCPEVNEMDKRVVSSEAGISEVEGGRVPVGSEATDPATVGVACEAEISEDGGIGAPKIPEVFYTGTRDATPEAEAKDETNDKNSCDPTGSSHPPAASGSARSAPALRLLESLNTVQVDKPLPPIAKGKRRRVHFRTYRRRHPSDEFNRSWPERSPARKGRSTSEKMRLTVQRSVWLHENLKSFAKSYKDQHTPRVVSTLKLPVLSPLKYLSGVRATLLCQQKLDEGHIAAINLPRIERL